MEAYDFDLFVIGGGSGGVRTARFSAAMGAKVALAESRYLGGTCVNVGCVPKKFLVYSAHCSETIDQVADFGWSVSEPVFDWSKLIANKDREIKRLNGAYYDLLKQNNVRLFEGHACIKGDHQIEVNGQQYTAKNILLAMGGKPNVPKFSGAEYIITSDEVFSLPVLPKRVLVIGGGYIAVEFSSIFNGLGVETTQIYRGDLFLRGFDQCIRSYLKEELEYKGINLKFNTEISNILKQDDGSLLVSFSDSTTQEVDCVFSAIGRHPSLLGMGLENTSVRLTDAGFVEVDDNYQTSVPSIYAVGDILGNIQLTPVALAEGSALAQHLFAGKDKVRIDYNLIPTAVFSLPNVAVIGLTENDALEEGLPVTIYESRFRPMKYTLGANQEKVFMKLVVDKVTDKILGCHLIGPDVGELMQGIAIALKAGATKAIFDSTIGIHPTTAEEIVTMRTSRK